LHAISLVDNIDKLSHARARLAFIYDSFSQPDDFEFSEFGGVFGLTIILEEPG